MAPANTGRTGKGIGDVASLFGRILRTALMYLVVSTVLVTSPLQAAPCAAIVMDALTGEVLYEKNADTRLHPASLTKMMTLYIAFEEIERGRLSLDTMVTVSKNGWLGMSGSLLLYWSGLETMFFTACSLGT